MKCYHCGGGEDTGNTHSPGCPNGPNYLHFEVPKREGAMGWICPVCGRGLAPWTPSCGCIPWPQPASVTVTDTGWGPVTTGDGTGEVRTLSKEEFQADAAKASLDAG